MNTFWYIAMIIAGLYGAFAALLMFTQHDLVYYPNLPSREIIATPSQIGLAYDQIKIVTEDGLKLDGWYIPAQNARSVVLFFHGNAGNISHRLDSLQLFHKLGLSILIFDYRGYGQSEGEISEAGSYRDAEAAWRYITEQRQVPAQDVILFGRSMGGAIAAYLASQHTPKGLIVESTFTSVPDMAAGLYPFMPVRWLSRIKYNTKAYIQSVTSPVLIIHSSEDEIIPFVHGQALFSAANEPKQFLEIRGGHNDGFIISERLYIDGLNTFLATLPNI